MSIGIAAIARNKAGLRASSAANAAAVGTIYFVQVVAASSSYSAASSLMPQLLPGATLAGYAIGVAYCAFAARDLTSPHDLVIHVCWLVSSLVLASAAPNGTAELLACLAVGVGCALTQRLLALVGSAVAEDERPRAIGALIGAGLCGIVLARAGSAAALMLAGARIILLLDAVLIGVLGLSAASAWFARGGERMTTPAIRGSALAAWRAHAELRHSALQLALVFACYNFAWITFVRAEAGMGASAFAKMAVVSGLGAAAALWTGRVCSRYRPAAVARFGLSAVLLAAALGFTARTTPLLVLTAMVLIDAGTQMVLVASQARAQSLTNVPAVRGRFAAIVTTTGFFGGAAGAGLAGLLA